MGEREELERERDLLAKEYFVELLPKSIDIDRKIHGLAFKEPENESNEIIAKIILTEEFVKEYSKLEREKEEVDAKRREIWKRILEINEKLM